MIYDELKTHPSLHATLTHDASYSTRGDAAAARLFRVLVDEWEFMPREYRRAFAQVLSAQDDDHQCGQDATP